MSSYKIDFYSDNKGYSATMAFVEQLKQKGDKQSKTLANAIYRRLYQLSQNGTIQGMPDFEYIENSRHNLWQIRIKHISGAYRIFICLWRDNTYVVLNYFSKKTRKTPKAQITLAESLMDDYIIRMEGGE